MEGYIKLYRRILDNPTICKDSEYYAVWSYLLLMATHKKQKAWFDGNEIMLKPGQLITGRRVISMKFNISESKVQRILKTLNSEQLIEQQTTNTNRLITIKNWSKYQKAEQPFEQRVNNKRTTSEQRVNTNKNDNNVKNEKNIGARAQNTPYYVFDPNDCETKETPEEREARIRKLRGLD